MGASVTVRVGGCSGMGKSAVVHRFLDDLVRQGSALVLRGRAYEREVVPYKAVDGVVDALSRYLMCLTDEDLSVALPKDTWALARLFPVLRRVQGIAAPAEERVTDPQRVRRRAFVALRELFTSLARRRPLVVFIDDAQWGDTDSAALLLELVRPPDAPPLLLVMTHREEEQQASPSRGAGGALAGARRSARPLGRPSRAAEAQRLALSLARLEGEPRGRRRRPSRASPAAVRSSSRSSRATWHRSTHPSPRGLREPSRSSLEQMVRDRIERLPDEARRLLEIVAVSGRPVPDSLASQCRGRRRGERPRGLISLLRARRFVRAGLRAGREVMEMVQERIRETMVAESPPPRSATTTAGSPARSRSARERRRRAWLPTCSAPEHGERAAQFAERAAEEAAAKLASTRLCTSLRLTIDDASAVVGGRRPSAQASR